MTRSLPGRLARIETAIDCVQIAYEKLRDEEEHALAGEVSDVLYSLRQLREGTQRLIARVGDDA